VHIACEDGEAMVGGPATRRWERIFAAGSGRVFAIKFRPGGFRPFVDSPVSDFADRVVPLRDVFASAPATFARDVLSSDHERAVAHLEALLRGRQPQADANLALVVGIAERIAVDRDLTRIEQVAAAFALTPRTLQRLFREYVGVGPKWVIQRYRLHEVVERVEANTAVDWAALSVELGYADQAHLIRDFTKLVGRTPAAYARDARAKS
jgi:AraC-like DNA-binding protein